MRKLESDFALRDFPTFLMPLSGNKLIIGHAACIGTPSSGAVAAEQDVGIVIQYANQGTVMRNQVGSLKASAWGLNCYCLHAGCLIGGTDNGKIVVWNRDGSERLREIDLCQLVGHGANSLNIKAVTVKGSKVFVASLIAGSFSGRIDSFDLSTDVSTE